MSIRVVLCADEKSQHYPEILGLEDENLDEQPWLQLFSSAQQVRTFLRNVDADVELWVVSSEDIDPINLAAMCKQDCPERNVCLYAPETNGSLQSRARQAKIDRLLDQRGFVVRYAKEKRRELSSLQDFGSTQDLQTRIRKSSRIKEDRVKDTLLQNNAQNNDDSAPKTLPSTHTSHSDIPRVSRQVSTPKHAPATLQRQGVVPMRPSAEKATLLPILSGSGGAGKSTISVLSALLLSRIGYRVLLIDLDLQFGDIDVLIGAADTLRVDDAIYEPAHLKQLKATPQMPALLAAPLHLENAEAIIDRLPWLLDSVSGAFDVIVANTGSFWLEVHALVLERCTKALFVIDQSTSSMRACRHALELCTRCGIAARPLLFLLNRCSKKAQFSPLDVSCALRGSQVFELKDGGRDIEELLAIGEPQELLELNNPLCTSLERVLVEHVPGCASSSEDGSGIRSFKLRHDSLFKRMLKRGAACLS